MAWLRLALFALLAPLALVACQTGGSGAGGAQHHGVGASDLGAVHIAGLRKAAGHSALAPDSRLEKAAISQAAYMASAGKMKHTTGWGHDFATRMRQAGVDAPAAENLAHGRMEPQQLFSMWMASSGHRTNMLDPRFSRYGLAYATTGDGQRYWALVLGR